MDFAIRAATVADVDRLALIGSASFLESYAGTIDGAAIVAHCARAHSAAAYADYLAAGARAWLAEAATGGAPIGYALVGPPDLPGAQAGDLELKRIYTLSRAHGSGLGAALMERAIEAAVAAGAVRLLLGVYRDNARALAFYAKHGFVPIGERRFRVGDVLYDDVVLARRVG